MGRQIAIRPVFGVFEQQHLSILPRQPFEGRSHQPPPLVRKQPVKRIGFSRRRLIRRQPSSIIPPELALPSSPAAVEQRPPARPPTQQRRHLLEVDRTRTHYSG